MSFIRHTRRSGTKYVYSRQHTLRHYLCCVLYLRSYPLRRLRRLDLQRVGYTKGRACRCSHWPRKSRQLLRCECGWNGSLHRKLGQYSQGDKTLPIEALRVTYLFFSRSGPNQMRLAKLVVVQLCHTLRTMRRARARFYLPAIFVIVISCVVYFISSSLAERRLCVCHYRVAVSSCRFQVHRR